MTVAQPEISVITPMFNEQRDIRENVRRILSALEGLGVSWEYILVDDGSTDGSRAAASEILDGRADCRIVGYRVNRGRGYALRQGFAVARGKYIITTESDLSWGEGIIAALYEKLVRDECDVVVASVHLPGGGYENVPAGRRWLSSYSNVLMRWCFGGDVTMLSGMTRGYRADVIQSLQLEADNKEIHLEIIAKAKALGYQIAEIPAVIRWRPSTSGRRRGGIGSMARFIIPHLISTYSFGASKILTSGTILLALVGLCLIGFGFLNKLFLITPAPMPNLITYGLVIVLLAVMCALFTGLSLQVGNLSKSLTHAQHQLERLRRSIEADPSRKPGGTEGEIPTRQKK